MEELKILFRSKTWLGLLLLLVIIDLAYPITATFDTGHYLKYLPILAGKVPLEYWDPVRGVIFPGYLYLATALFGESSNALLIPMIFQHIILFILTSFLLLPIVKTRTKWVRILLMLFIFVFIALDPLIVGYYHTALTEHVASTIAIISCVAAVELVKSASEGKVNLRTKLCFAYFLVAVPVAWHLKQPYVGAAWFPVMIASVILLLIRKSGKKLRIFTIGANFLIAGSLGISILAWNLILPDTGYAATPKRQISSYITNMITKDLELASQSASAYSIHIMKNYAALANVFYYDYRSGKVIKITSFTRAFENELIAYRMYLNYGQTNIFPQKEEFYKGVETFQSLYLPPQFLNDIFKSMIIKANLLFSTLNFYSPVILLVSILLRLLIIKKSQFFDMMIIYCGTATANLIGHSFIDLPIDRYLFMGYPLLLIVILGYLLTLLRFVYEKSGSIAQLLSSILRTLKLKVDLLLKNAYPRSSG